MCIENKISKFFVTVSKFEYFLINNNIKLGKVSDQSGALQKISGLDWNKLSKLIEQKQPFDLFNFSSGGFEIFKNEPPQFLVKENGNLKWDSDETIIDSWEILLSKSFAQLRNNIAHGNRVHLPSHFTQGRTEQFIDAGYSIMNFIAEEVLQIRNWEEPIYFSN